MDPSGMGIARLPKFPLFISPPPSINLNQKIAAIILDQNWQLPLLFPSACFHHDKPLAVRPIQERNAMTVQIVGTSQNSWEEATRTAIANAKKCVRGLLRAEVINQDVILKESESISTYRVRLNIFISVNGDTN